MFPLLFCGICGRRIALRCVVLSLLSIDATLAADDMRVWTDASGTITKEGSLDRADGKWVHLKLADGSSVRLPLGWLSQADQDYVASKQQPNAHAGPSVPASVPSAAAAAGTTAGQPSSLVSLTVNGIGISKDDAEKDAYRNAIRQVVGAYVDAETIVANDEVIRDKVITLSSAYVERAATKSVAQENGLTKVAVDAQVRITKLLDALKQHNVSVVEIDPSAAQDAIARSVTQEDQAKSQEELLARALRNYPESCLKVTVDGKPTFTKTAIQFRIKVEPDMEAFAAVADKVCEALSADGRKNGILRNDSKNFHHNDTYTTRDPTPFEMRTLGDIAARFQNTHHIGLSEVSVNSEYIGGAVKKLGTLAISPVLSLSMETPNGLRNPQAVFWPNQDNQEYIFVPFRTNKSLQRIHWRWFAFSQKDREVFVANYIHAAAITSSLQASDGSEVADDVTAINLGWSHASNGNGVWVLAPFCCSGYAPAIYVPAFVFQRSIELAPDELQQIRTVQCSVQAAQWPHVR